MSRLVVYTDGACKSASRPGLGHGGWAWWTDNHGHDAGAVPDTTNNRMELLAVVQAIQKMAVHHPYRQLLIVSDSAYVVNCFKDHWYEGWLDRNWRNAQGKAVQNKDLWEPLLGLVLGHPTDVAFRHCRGHGRGGPEDAPYVHGNDQADRLAVAARKTLER